MAQTIFFSWQADTPNKVGRNFIREVLQQVQKELSTDATITEALRDIRIDSDTQGVPGQPPVVDTILRKIDEAALVVADMTFTGTRNDGRPTPNPNVLIEYGWALKSLSHGQVICLMNTVYGEPSETTLPFDLRHLRWPICYTLAEDASTEERATARRQLTNVLKKAIVLSLDTIPAFPKTPPAPFNAVQPKNGVARFRAHAEALGYEWDGYPRGENQEVFLVNGPAIWLRLMPMCDPGKVWTVRELKDKALQNSRLHLTPFAYYAAHSGGLSFFRSADGVGTSYPSVTEDKNGVCSSSSVAFAFTTGEVWGIDTIFLSFDGNTLPYVEPEYVRAIVDYTRFLESLGLRPPYKYMAGISGTKGRYFQVPPPSGHYHFGPGSRCAAEEIVCEGEYREAEGALSALRPFFAKVFDMVGLDRPDYLDTQLQQLSLKS